MHPCQLCTQQAVRSPILIFPPSQEHDKKLTVPELEERFWLPDGKGEPRRWCCVLPWTKAGDWMCWQLGGRGGQKPRVRGRGRTALPLTEILPGQHAAPPPGMPTAASQPAFRKAKEAKESAGQWDGSIPNTAVTGTKRCSRGTWAETMKTHLCALVIQLESPAWHRQSEVLQGYRALEHRDTTIPSVRSCRQRPVVFPREPCCPCVSHLPERPANESPPQLPAFSSAPWRVNISSTFKEGGRSGGDTASQQQHSSRPDLTEQGTHAISTQRGPRGPATSKAANNHQPLGHFPEGLPYTSHPVLLLWVLKRNPWHPSSRQAQACTVYSANWIFCVPLLRVLSFSHFVKVVMSQKAKKELTSSRPAGWKNKIKRH